MPKNIPFLKPKELIKFLEKAGCTFHREGKGDHCLYTREFEGWIWIDSPEIYSKILYCGTGILPVIYLQELKLITFTGLIFTLSQAGSLCHLT